MRQLFPLMTLVIHSLKVIFLTKEAASLSFQIVKGKRHM